MRQEYQNITSYSQEEKFNPNNAYCSYCLSEHTCNTTVKRKDKSWCYPQWYKDKEGRKICKRCYQILLKRERHIGIYRLSRRRKIYAEIKRLQLRLKIEKLSGELQKYENV